MLEFAAPEIGEVISVRKGFKSAAKSVGNQTLKKQLGKGNSRRTGGSKQRREEESIQQNLPNNPVDFEETFLQTFLVDHVKQ